MAAYAAVVKENSVDYSGVKVGASLGQASAVADREGVVLETKSFVDDFVQDWQRDVEVPLALQEVLDPWVACRLLSIFVLELLLLLVDLDVAHLLDEVLSNRADNVCFLVQNSV